mmetsp:Transcript_6451/g.9448  ORF Transcript_6451/g.9448 Transcript_6451/m.9448 type:complete len:374 (+) Transcript_6451:96-1217(+)|eukprot:CAMPEP_0194090966 /NCGR_PEP_ID=MMETSP0149-20130528/41096_1 /TAXON_ID=122233 /ORGANISM="Chaetoceros debilis, Strain MM31A-1" /LENGTH=373 /DNA_ID=CAMNT_0038775401 /DNA_START=54 /DNA_END=1175 /DNA_ORIENTATION=+
MMEVTWIYHERQQAQLCGQHALNNLLQIQSFAPQELAEIALQLDQMELNFMSQSNSNGVRSKDYLNRLAEGSGNVDESGNFSIEVLRSALQTKYNLTLANTLQEAVKGVEITNFDGFICNKSSHWFAIRKINGRFWNLNSLAERPEQISHFRLAAEIGALRASGYSVFCVVEIGGLPKDCCISEENQNDLKVRGMVDCWWKEEDLIKGTGIKGYSSPWNNVGTGMRLDGKKTTNPPNSSSMVQPESASQFNVEGLTEDEMIAMAMALSTEKQSLASDGEDALILNLTPEPASGPGVVRIQFRIIPDGKKIERRFLNNDLVSSLEAFVRQQSNSTGKLVMKAGFPPREISHLYEKTISDAKLSGEQIQCRFSLT